MTAQGLMLFDTSIGRCGIAWGPRGVTAIQLPQAREAETLARLQQRLPDARPCTPPASVTKAIDDIGALLRGEATALSEILLDMEGVPPFHRRVYEVARTIPAGETRSYGEIAVQLGSPGSARAVGQALGRNPFAIVVPCHRVLAAKGRMGGFSAEGGIKTKLRLLALESPRPSTTANSGETAWSYAREQAVAHLRRADPGLVPLLDAVGPCALELKATTSVFLALAEAIVYQQLHGKAAATIFSRVCALFPYGVQGPTPELLLRVPEDSLRGAGLSQAKLNALRDLAAKVLDGTVPPLAEIQGMDDEALIERLTEVRGIGRWTVEMMLIFRLGRPDVLPTDDYGVRKGFARTFGHPEMPTRQELMQRGELWKPFRTVASWYLWRANDLPPSAPARAPVAKAPNASKSARSAVRPAKQERRTKRAATTG